MKFGQLTEYNKNLFSKNHTQNVLEKIVPDFFLKNNGLTISLDQ